MAEHIQRLIGERSEPSLEFDGKICIALHIFLFFLCQYLLYLLISVSSYIIHFCEEQNKLTSHEMSVFSTIHNVAIVQERVGTVISKGVSYILSSGIGINDVMERVFSEVAITSLASPG